MVKTKFKRAVSLVMAAVLSLGVFANIGTTAYAASGTKSDVYIMQLPRIQAHNNDKNNDLDLHYADNSHFYVHYRTSTDRMEYGVFG